MSNGLQIRIWKSTALPKDWLERTKTREDDEAVERSVREIVATVRELGDLALTQFTEKFDKAVVTTKGLRITSEEVKAAYAKVSKKQISALKTMKQTLAANEKNTLGTKQRAFSKNGVQVQTMRSPLESVGCYVPGGRAVYPSTLIMTAVPAKVAGVHRIVVCTPPASDGTIDPLVLVAADICEVEEIYRVGGVQAIAALAYGTETIKPVCKIVGPGSRYVTAAKIFVSKDVAIDMPAGPSEVLVLADETANSKFIAADMISQVEHGVDSIAGLMTNSGRIKNEVVFWLETLTSSAERGETVRQALSKHGFIITCDTMDEMVVLANLFAPEHLEIIIQNPRGLATKMISAGLILLGPFSPVAFSDYASGTNHVLPTGGFGHAFSGLSALDFTRRMCIVEASKVGLAKAENRIKVLTEAEGLPNHYKAVMTRFEN